MTPVAWMVGTTTAAWLVVTALGGARVHPEALYGLLGPLGSACAAWVVMARAHRAGPEQLTRAMIKGFMLKMLFFVAYVALMIRGLELRPVPFVLSLVGYLIALYAIEALFLARLFARDKRNVSTA